MKLVTFLFLVSLTTYYFTDDTENADFVTYPYNHYIFSSSTMPFDLDEEIGEWNMLDNNSLDDPSDS